MADTFELSHLYGYNYIKSECLVVDQKRCVHSGCPKTIQENNRWALHGTWGRIAKEIGSSE